MIIIIINKSYGQAEIKHIYDGLFIPKIFVLFGGWTRSKIYLELFQIIWGLVWVKVMSPVPFDLPLGNMKKKKIILGKRLISPTNPNKHQLTFNFQANFLSSGMLINGI